MKGGNRLIELLKHLQVAHFSGDGFGEDKGLLTVMHIMIHINAYKLAYREEQS